MKEIQNAHLLFLLFLMHGDRAAEDKATFIQYKMKEYFPYYAFLSK